MITTLPTLLRTGYRQPAPLGAWTTTLADHFQFIYAWNVMAVTYEHSLQALKKAAYSA